MCLNIRCDRNFRSAQTKQGLRDGFLSAFPFLLYPLSPLRSPRAKPHASCEILTKPTQATGQQRRFWALASQCGTGRKRTKSDGPDNYGGPGDGDGRTQGRQGFSAPNHSLFSGQEAKNWTAYTHPYPHFFVKKNIYLGAAETKNPHETPN